MRAASSTTALELAETLPPGPLSPARLHSRGPRTAPLWVSRGPCQRDFAYRGDHPIMRAMNLYVYSMWVYRCENPDGCEGADGGLGVVVWQGNVYFLFASAIS